MEAQADADAAQGQGQVVADPQLVANSFVEQYYKLLHHFPHLLHRFYQDSSILGRPGPNGLMTSVSTINAINERIISLDYNHLQTEILAVDAQVSHCGGVIVLVTGFLTGKDNVKRKFAQSFFLAPQEKGFYVLNDVFRYVDDHHHHHHHKVRSDDHHRVGGDETAPAAPLATSSVAHDDVDVDDDYHHNTNPNNGKANSAESSSSSFSSVPEKEDPNPRIFQDASNSKKSFASIVNAWKDNSAPFKAPPPKPHVERSRVASASKASASAPAPTSIDNASKRHDNNRPVSSAKSKGFSIFVANLPIDATVEQLKEMFEKFGPIIPNAVQIRTNKLRPNCFGFVEFETVTSMLSAIQASPIVLANRKIFVEEKKAGSDSPLKPTPIGYENNNYKVTSNSSIGYPSNNYKVTFNAPVTTGRNTAGESTIAPQKEGGRRVAYQAKV